VAVKASRIFVSYRRQDSPGFAGQVADHLERYFGVRMVLRGALLVSCLSCGYARTGYLLDTLNDSPPAKPGPVIDIPTRVARLTRDALADSYFDPATTARWMDALGTDTPPIASLTECLSGAPPQPGYGSCYERFTADTVLATRWGIPEAPASIDLTRPALVELDAQRLLANTISLGSSLAALTHSAGAPISAPDLARGVSQGAHEAAEYIKARSWHRRLGRPTTALVLSGGAANGAFTAGAMFRLFEILEACRKAPSGGCGEAHVDLVAGSSTGALIGLLIDMYSTPGMEQKARDLLLANYTCVVESDLYCLHSTWDWNLADDVRGLVHFDGIHKRLDAAITPELAHNGTELVTVSVDYDSGDLYGLSDQDPADRASLGTGAEAERERHAGRINAVMASIVAPVLADPVEWVPGRGRRIQGTFLDGGVRSGLPVLQALQRGAERVVIFANAGIEPDRRAGPEHAFGILQRTLDLMAMQPRMSELQQGEFGAVSRRFAEYNVCDLRLHAAAGAAAPDSDIGAFCRRAGGAFAEGGSLPQGGPAVARAVTSVWIGPGQFEQIATSWRSAWVFRPERGSPRSAAGYAFHPKVMRPLFESGITTFQSRCRELTELLAMRGTVVDNACREAPAAVVQRARAKYTPIAACTDDKPERRTCP
jgi:predicted acylesterase/phospholipase RssA